MVCNLKLYLVFGVICLVKGAQNDGKSYKIPGSSGIIVYQIPTEEPARDDESTNIIGVARSQIEPTESPTFQTLSPSSGSSTSLPTGINISTSRSMASQAPSSASPTLFSSNPSYDLTSVPSSSLHSLARSPRPSSQVPTFGTPIQESNVTNVPSASPSSSPIVSASNYSLTSTPSISPTLADPIQNRSVDEYQGNASIVSCINWDQSMDGTYVGLNSDEKITFSFVYEIESVSNVSEYDLWLLENAMLGSLHRELLNCTEDTKIEWGFPLGNGTSILRSNVNASRSDSIFIKAISSAPHDTLNRKYSRMLH